jgi:hypothetical protein
VELIFFIAVKHVVLGGPFFNGMLDAQSEGYQTDTVLTAVGIETRLIKREGSRISKTVQHCGRKIVESKNEKPQPAARQCQASPLIVECHQAAAVQRIGPAAHLPSQVMQRDKSVQRFLSLRVGLSQLEMHPEIGVQTPSFAPQVIPMLRT